MSVALVLIVAAVTVGLVLLGRALDADGPWEPKP